MSGRSLVVLVAILVAVAVAVAGPATARAADCTTPGWTPSWSASPTDAATGGFEGQTVRELITPHLGGTSVRLHLSNRFGTQSVTFDQVTIARSVGTGPDLIPSTLRAVTFDGERAVAVAPGTDAVSDPVPITFAAFQPLAVSMYFGTGTGPATQHLVGRHSAWATPERSGVDRTADPSAADFDTLDSTATFFATRLDVLAPASTGVVVALGDSLTDGYEGSPQAGYAGREGIDADGAYPDVLQRRIALNPAGGGGLFTVLNAGITGNRILTDAPIAAQGASALNRLQSDVLALPGVTTVIILLGANDLGDQTDAAEIVTGLARLVARVRAAGKTVVLGTLTPMVGAQSATYGDELAETRRQQVNAWIRGGTTGADAVVDFDAVLTDPGRPGRLREPYDSGDGLHPNLAGYRAMADAIALATLDAPPQLRAALAVTVPRRYRSRLRRAVVTIDGRRAGTIRRAGGSVTVDFARATRTIATVRTRITLSDGRTVTSSRRVARCVG